VDSPLVLPSLYAAPALDLPAAVLAAPNFSTGWLLMCSAWAQHRGEEEAVQSIKRVLIIVAKAAWGNANWQEQADPSGAQQTAASAAAAPSLPTASATAASKPDSGSTSTNPLVRGVLGWLDYASKALVSDLSTSVHVFTPVPASTPLLDSREKFKLHPQLLQSLLYAFQFFPHYRTNSTQWLALFKQLVSTASALLLARPPARAGELVLLLRVTHRLSACAFVLARYRCTRLSGAARVSVRPATAESHAGQALPVWSAFFFSFLIFFFSSFFRKPARCDWRAARTTCSEELLLHEFCLGS
jgi:hypothetical protein